METRSKRKQKKIEEEEDEEVVPVKKTSAKRKKSESETTKTSAAKKKKTAAKKKKVSVSSDEEEDYLSAEETGGYLPKPEPPTFDKSPAEGSEELIDLLAFDPGTLNSRDDFSAQFAQIADKLMNQFVMVINGKPHRLSELEFYFCGDKHQDVFTHQDELQKSSGNWYFHRMGSGYKGGNYKGIDITFGQKGYGGILIRAIETMDGDYLEGPSCCVDQILTLNATRNGIPEIITYVGTPNFDIKVTKRSSLYLEKDDNLEQRDVVSGPRFGLSLKKTDGDRTYFITKPYRFMSHPLRVRKGRANLVIGLHAEGKSIDQIQKLTGVAKGTIQNYVNEFDTGKKESLETFTGKTFSTAAPLCQLVGFITTLHPYQ